jgi:hypothetical protein
VRDAVFGADDFDVTPQFFSCLTSAGGAGHDEDWGGEKYRAKDYSLHGEPGNRSLVFSASASLPCYRPEVPIEPVQRLRDLLGAG